MAATHAETKPKFLIILSRALGDSEFFRPIKKTSNGKTAPTEYPPSSTEARRNCHDDNSKIPDSHDDLEYSVNMVYFQTKHRVWRPHEECPRSRRLSQAKMGDTELNFLAIDFETADYEPDSACAIGLVRVSNGIIVSRTSYLIRPPREEFVFTYIHGISWEDVKASPTFDTLWPEIAPMFYNVDFLVAHNARFDQNVLYTCCDAAGVGRPKTPFRCSMITARKVWGIYPTKLPNVCRHLQISLNHHEASSDAEACALIMIKALEHRE